MKRLKYKDKRKDKRTLHAKAWKIWSTYRRKSEANFQDLVRCFTCRKLLPYREAHLGHFKHRKLDFDPINTNVQCPGCNTYAHGRLDVYGVNLVEKYGLHAIKDLERRAQEKGNNYSEDELREVIQKYGNK